MLEKNIERYLCERVRAIGGLSFKFTSPGNPGVPDRIVILPDGRTVYVELKACWGRLARIQQYQIDRMRKLGADVRVIKGMDEARALVKELGGRA